MQKRCAFSACLLAMALTATMAAASTTGQPVLPIAPSSVTPTYCPMATPEPLWVDPLTSPTELLTQTITIYIGNGAAVTITAESGVFAASGSYNAYDNPARVQISLLPETIHHLLVAAKVRETIQYGCPFGGYVLTTRSDRAGNELTIQHVASATATTVTQEHRLLLPVILSP
jgi:hypothetical protein